MRVLDSSKITNKITKPTFSLFVSNQGTVIYQSITDGYFLEDQQDLDSMFDHISNIEKCLVIGLGPGIIPTYLQNKFPQSKIQVIDNDKDLIDTITYLQLIPTTIELIHKDVFDFESEYQYDLIVVDIWGYGTEKGIKEKSILQSKLSKNLTDKGRFYFPIIN